MQVSAPFGLRPSQHYSGLARTNWIDTTKALAEATPTLFQNQPCLLDASGRLAAAAAGAGNLIIGCFQGVEYVDNATQRPVVSNRWVNGTTVADRGAQSARFYFTRNPDIIYDIQANAAMVAEDIAELGSIAGVTGNATTGISTSALDVATLAAAADQLKVYNIFLDPANTWTDPFPIVQVLIAQHQEYPALLGV